MWTEIIDFLRIYFIDNSCAHDITVKGYCYFFELIKSQSNQGLLDYDKYVDLAGFREKIAKEIIYKLHKDGYALDSLKEITTLILIPENQNLLFDMNINANATHSPIYFFKNNFWKQIITSDSFENISFRDRLVCWVPMCCNLTTSEQKELGICPYFITLFILQLFVFDVKICFEQRKQTIEKIITKEPSIKFILQCIMYHTVKKYTEYYVEDKDMYNQRAFIDFVKYTRSFDENEIILYSKNLNCINKIENIIDSFATSLNINFCNEADLEVSKNIANY